MALEVQNIYIASLEQARSNFLCGIEVVLDSHFVIKTKSSRYDVHIVKTSWSWMIRAYVADTPQGQRFTLKHLGKMHRGLT